MSGIMKIERCGTCHFGEIISSDLTKRLCFGAPPSSIQLATTTPGQMTLQSSRPIVNVTDRACALYRAKNAYDAAQDNTRMRELNKANEDQPDIAIHENSKPQ